MIDVSANEVQPRVPGLEDGEVGAAGREKGCVSEFELAKYTYYNNLDSQSMR